MRLHLPKQVVQNDLVLHYSGMGIVTFIDDEFALREFHFTDINNTIGPLNQKVYLSSISIAINCAASTSPGGTTEIKTVRDTEIVFGSEEERNVIGDC